MPVFNVTVDDASPMWFYSDSWASSRLPEDRSLTTSTTHQTSLNGKSTSLFMTGTAVSIYGTTGPDHGPFAVNFTNVPQQAGLTAQSDVERHEQLLLSSVSILQDVTEVKIAAEDVDGSGSSLFDLDYAVVSMGDGNLETIGFSQKLDDTHPNIVYQCNWETTPLDNISSQYFDGTMHRTTDGSAKAVLSFAGNWVAVYGGTRNDHGMYSIQIDGGTVLNYTGTSTDFHAQNLLFYTHLGGNTEHQLIIKNETPGGWLDIDYVEVHAWGVGASKAGITNVSSSNNFSPGSTTTPALEAPSPTAVPSKLTSSGNSAAAAAGAVIGAVILLALIAGGVMYYIRRRNQLRQREHRQAAAAFQRDPAWNGTEKSAAVGSGYPNQPYLPPYEA